MNSFKVRLPNLEFHLEFKMEFHLVQDRAESFHRDRFPFDVGEVDVGFSHYGLFFQSHATETR